MKTFTFGAAIDDVCVVQVREGWHVLCSRCGPSPRPHRSEQDAVRGRWSHEEQHLWPDWMTRSRGGRRHAS
jgi:hypothetical protein